MVLKTQGQNLYLAGEGTRGTLYAVNSFLEEKCGVRWWTPFAETVPSDAELTVALPDTVYQPQFSYRNTNFMTFTGTIHSTPSPERQRFSVRRKNNGNSFNGIPAELGGTVALVAHPPTYTEWGQQIITTDEFGKTHPEWFALVDGKRPLYMWQLCFTEPSLRPEILKRVKAWVDRSPDQNRFAILHNDNHNYCRCEQCAAVDAEEGSQMGTQLRFINWLAEELEKHRPGIEIVTEAYQHTTEPPKITRPRANVIIMLCCPFGTLETPAENEKFMKQWNAWKPIAPRILVWDYAVNFYGLIGPWPNVTQLGAQVKTLARQGAMGVFMQGNMFTAGGDCEELKSWLLARLMWDPTLDPLALVQEFVSGYYGAAAGPVTRYLDHLTARGVAKGASAGPSALGWMDLAAMNTAQALLDEARAKASGQPQLEERIARLQIAIDWQWMYDWGAYRDEAKRTNQQIHGPSTWQQAYNNFREDAQRFSIIHVNEHFGYNSMDQLLAEWGAFLNPWPKAAKLPAPYDRIPAEDVLEIQDPYIKGVARDAAIVDDPAAANGKAVRMTCGNRDWAIQVDSYFFSRLKKLTDFRGKWTVLVFVRADANKPTGIAMDLGIHNRAHPSTAVARTVKIEELTPGAYTPIEVGVLDLDLDREVPVQPFADSCIWSAPVDNPQVMNAMFIDRVVLVRKGLLEQQTK